MEKLKVAIVGAGATGLIACKVLQEHQINCQVFERSSHSGGQWYYSSIANNNSTSAVYEALKTNIPHYGMQLTDYSFPQQTEKYPTHQVILNYLINYSNHFNLNQWILYDTTVQLIKGNPTTGYEIIYTRNNNNKNNSLINSSYLIKETNGQLIYKQHFNAIVTANGHFTSPYYPPIPNLFSLPTPRVLTHSFYYRTPSPYQNQIVLVIGASFSGIDIAGELTEVSQFVYLSARREKNHIIQFESIVSRLREAGKPICLESKKFELIEEIKEVIEEEKIIDEGIDDNSIENRRKGHRVMLMSGRIIAVDVILCATGYHYTFPFFSSTHKDNSLILSSFSNISSVEETSEFSSLSDYDPIIIDTADCSIPTPLYHQLFLPSHREFLSFPAISWSIIPFPLTEVQITWQARLLKKQCCLPSEEEMKRIAIKEREGKFPPRYQMKCSSMIDYVESMMKEWEQSEGEYNFRFKIREDRSIRRISIEGKEEKEDIFSPGARYY